MSTRSSENKNFNARAFRECLGQFSTGVTVITAAYRGERVGVTVNSFSSLSLDPPLVLWAIARTSRSFSVFDQTRHFAINILADDQVEVSQHFSGKTTDKFADAAWRPGTNGAPLIDGTAATIECDTETRYDGGDHVLIIGRVTRFTVEPRNVLIFSQGRYSIGVDHPVLRARVGAGQETPGSVDAAVPDSFGTLVFKSHLAWSTGFTALRSKLGLSVGKARLLYVLSRFEKSSADELVIKVNLPAPEIADDVADLEARGDVKRNPDGSLSLTEAGRKLREAMLQNIGAYEAATLAGISPADLEVTKATLERYLAHVADHT